MGVSEMLSIHILDHLEEMEKSVKQKCRAVGLEVGVTVCMHGKLIRRIEKKMKEQMNHLAEEGLDKQLRVF